MANQQNSYGRRQRDQDSKGKTNQKLAPRKTGKKQPLKKLPELAETPPAMTSGQLRVLAVFRKYLMTPGKMLCMGSQDLESYRVQLAELTAQGFLISERFEAGYSLTTTGFDAMNEDVSAS